MKSKKNINKSMVLEKMPDVSHPLIKRGLIQAESLRNILDGQIQKSSECDIDFLFGKGFFEMRCDNKIDAVSTFSEIIKRKSDCAEAYYWRGVVWSSIAGGNIEDILGLRKYKKNQEYLSAVKDLTQTINIDSKYSMAFLRRSFLYRIAECYEDALIDANIAVEIDESLMIAAINSSCSFWLGKLDSLSRFIEKYPQNYFAYCVRAKIFEVKRDLKAAISDYSSAIQIHPDNCYSYMKRGALYEYDFPELAEADYCREKEIREQKKDIFLYYKLNNNFNISSDEIHNNKLNCARIIYYCGKNIEDNPVSLCGLYLEKALANVALGLVEEAVSDITQAIAHCLKNAFDDRSELEVIKSISSDLEMSLYNYWNFLISVSRYESAIIVIFSPYIDVLDMIINKYLVTYSKITKLIDTIDGQASWILWLSVKNGQPKLNEMIGKVYLERGRAYYKSGDYVAAIKDISRMIDLCGENSYLFYLRGQVLLCQCNYTEAITDFSRIFVLENEALEERRKFSEADGEISENITCIYSSDDEEVGFDEIFFIRGLTYLHLESGKGNNFLARSDFSAAIKINSEYRKAYFFRALTYGGNRANNYEIKLDIQAAFDLGFRIKDAKGLIKQDVLWYNTLEKLKEIGCTSVDDE